MRSEWVSDLVKDRRYQGAQLQVSARLAEATRLQAEWVHRAACRGMNPDLFFTERGAVDDHREARAVCAGCEVRAECLAYALAANEREGVFGGTSAQQRRRMRGRKAAA